MQEYSCEYLLWKKNLTMWITQYMEDIYVSFYN